MSKFLEGVEKHTPDKDIDAVTAAKRNVQRIFMKAGYTADAKVFRDDITLTLEDGTKVVLEIKSAIKPEAAAEEDFEMIDNMRQKKIDKFEKNSGNITGTLTAAQELRANDPDPTKPSRGVKRINKEVDKLGKVIAKNVKRVAKMLK